MEKQIMLPRTSRIWLGEDGILRVVILPGFTRSLADIKTEAAYIAQIAQGQKMPILMDIRVATSIARDSRMYFSSEAISHIVKAAALLIGSPVSRVVANFFIGFNKPPYPTRLFTSEDEALEWLKAFIE